VGFGAEIQDQAGGCRKVRPRDLPVIQLDRPVLYPEIVADGPDPLHSIGCQQDYIMF
jgi:hypothetical protein